MLGEMASDSKGDSEKLTDVEAQLSDDNANANASEGSSSMFRSLLSTSARVAYFGFNTAYDVGSSIINRVKGTNDDDVREGNSNGNNDDEEKVAHAVVTGVVEEPVVLTAERVELAEVKPANQQPELRRQPSWIDRREERRAERNEINAKPPTDEVIGVITAGVVLTGYFAFLLYGLVIVIQDMSDGNKLDSHNLLPNMLAFIILMLVQVFCLCGTIRNVGQGDDNNSKGAIPAYAFIWVGNYVYGWVIFGLVMASGNPSVCDPSIFAHANLIVLVVQVVQSLAVVFGIIYLLIVIVVYLFCMLKCFEAFLETCTSCCRSK